MNGKRFLLGVDGGGTNTRAWIVDAASDLSSPTVRPLGEGRSSSSNPISVGMDSAKHALLDAIGGARDSAGIAPDGAFAGACMGLAGVGGGPLATGLLSWAVQAINRPCAIVTDAEIALHAANENGVGIVLIAGTGSFAFARDRDGESHRCGGWGRLLGDEGGAYAMALDAFRHIVREEDGRAPKSSIRAAAFEYFSVSDVRAVHAQVTSGTPAVVAGFAPHLIRLADSDPVVASLVARHVEELVDLVRATIDRASLPNPTTLALTGGLLINCESFRSRLEALLSEKSVNVRTELVSQPVLGALRLAKQQALEI